MRCVLLGEESLLVQCAEALIGRGHGVVALVTRSGPLRAWAARHRIAVLADAAALLTAADVPAFDLLLSITNLQVLPPAVLALPRLAAINFHDGPLPEYAGLNTPVWALLNGEAQYGITWHRMSAQVDGGAILAQRRFAVDAQETALSLNTQCFAAAIEAFDEVLDLAERGALEGTPQPGAAQRVYRRKDRPEAAATLDWQQPVGSLLRTVRALDFGAYANPVLSARLWLGDTLWCVGEAAQVPTPNTAAAVAPGTVFSVDAGSLTVAAADGAVRLSRLTDHGGQGLDVASALAQRGLKPGDALPALTTLQREALACLVPWTSPHEGAWLQRLRAAEPLLLPLVDRSRPPAAADWHAIDAPLPAAADGGADAHAAATCDALTAAATWVACLARLADKPRFDIGLDTPEWQTARANAAPWYAPQVPLPVALDFAQDLAPLRAWLAGERDHLRTCGGLAADLAVRTPELRATGLQMPVALVLRPAAGAPQSAAPAWAPGNELVIEIADDGRRCTCWHDAARVSAAEVQILIGAWQSLHAAAVAPTDPDAASALGALPLMPPAQRDAVLAGWNATDGPVRADACMHSLFIEQAQRTPQRDAVRCEQQSLSYWELSRRAHQLAHRLVEAGVGPDVLVGLFLERSVELMVAVWGVHIAGGAYVPLDPAYPRERIAYMVEDARVSVLLTQERLLDDLPRHHAEVICLDADWPAIGALPATPLPDPIRPERARPDNLAYVIYTSGSTGRPKGVMIEHRNAVNFFAGMDAHLGTDEPGTWLAVTSLSFDISVLELCWTLTRGYTVVISSEDHRAAAARPRGAAAQRPLDFSLFYFSSDESADGSDKYRLLLDGARYADRHGFAAVWTPERHFHAFGGLYPNPSVTSAAIAAITQRIRIRSGSVVLPLHHPARVAEEWSVVDNLSKGRVGISFASGWQPDDFVLKPENFATNKQVMLTGIDQVRRLWRGESVSFPGALGAPVEVRILPRPVQPELPVWVTSAGNPETFIAAGRLGANVLTHLLGQTVEELADKLAAYRRAWQEAGHPGQPHVTLMLHSFVGPDAQQVRATVRRPLIEYLRSSLNLVKQYAWSFPAFKRREGMDTSAQGVDLQSLSTEEMDALLEHSFERYYETSGLFGTPDDCLDMVDRIKAVGVDEVACLIDFGVATDTVLAHLPYLNALRKQSTPRPTAQTGADTDTDHSLPALMARHQVTHLQCTPSMARMLAMNEAALPGLARLRCMMVGGEAFPSALAVDLKRLAPSTRLLNMYGPTETTIWSAVHEVVTPEAAIPLGRPLRNQALYILDARQQPVPPGVPGELVIGGRGVVRGYLRRPELTAERFIAHPLRPNSGERVYRTGDLARHRADGVVEFLGRLDHQVKVRGYRIELGEIEAAILAFPGVAEAVVVAREDAPGDVRLVGYLVPSVPDASEAAPDLDALRAQLRQRLPEHMVPAHLVRLSALPQTPNGKTDRKALPAPQAAAAPEATAAFVAPESGLEETIATVWKDVLKLAQVGVRDNFFDLGGHSLLAIQAHRRLREALARELAITDIFRFPTIQALARYLGDGAQAQGAAAAAGRDRADGRRAAMRGRQGARPGVTQS